MELLKREDFIYPWLYINVHRHTLESLDTIFIPLTESWYGDRNFLDDDTSCQCQYLNVHHIIWSIRVSSMIWFVTWFCKLKRSDNRLLHIPALRQTQLLFSYWNKQKKKWKWQQKTSTMLLLHQITSGAGAPFLKLYVYVKLKEQINGLRLWRMCSWLNVNCKPLRSLELVKTNLNKGCLPPWRFFWGAFKFLSFFWPSSGKLS